MKNKIQKIDTKAWIRILEVFIAILIIISAVLIIINRKPPEADINDIVYEKQRQILDIIGKNNSLRTEIITTQTFVDNPTMNNVISKIVPNSWNFSTNICELELSCANPKSVFEKNVYSTEIVITSNLTNYNPKKLKLFVWVK